MAMVGGLNGLEPWGWKVRSNSMKAGSNMNKYGSTKTTNRLVTTMCSKAKLWSTMLLSAALICPSEAFSAILKDVNFASLPGDRTEIRLEFDETPPAPQGYTIEQPARIAVDFVGASSALQAKYHNLGAGNAQGLTVIEAKDRIRMIINLLELVPYSTRVDGSTVVLVVGGSEGGSVAQAKPASTAQESAVVSGVAKMAGKALSGVDFKRGEKGDGQVVITLTEPNVDVDMSEVAGSIRLEFKGVKLPTELQKRFDVTDFATAVKRIDAITENGNAVILIKPEGHYDFLAYQADSEFTVSVEGLSEDDVERRRQEKFPYSGEKLSLNFQDIEVRSVLQLIADFTGLNLVASDSVSGTITLRLQNVPWDQALELILKTKGLDKRKVGNVLMVAPAAEIAQREKLELEANKQVSELAPVSLDVIQVNYAKAADIVGLLKQDKDLISERGFISSDARTNTISLRETAEKQEQIRRLVAKWDVPVRQVLIEARIVRAQKNSSMDMGVQWGGAFAKSKGDSLYTVSGNQNAQLEVSDQAASGSSVTVPFPDALAVDLGLAKTNASSIAVGFANDQVLLSMELAALEVDGQGEVISQPKIVTADRQQATIKSGEEIPYQEASSSGATSVSFKEAALSLQVTPQITPDDKIIMDLVISQDSRGTVTAGIPSINTNEIKTQVLVSNGETVVLGGIFEATKTTTVTKTPFLGDLPYVGKLFSKNEDVDNRSELLVFITPKLLKEGLVDQ